MSCIVQDFGPASRQLPRKPSKTKIKKSAATKRKPGTKPKPVKLTIAKARKIERAAQHNALQAQTLTAKRHATRSRATTFPFMRLPPELRNIVYTHALTTAKPPLGLAAFTVPPLLSTTRQLRAEALGFATQVNEFSVSVRCSWCAVGAHAVSEEHPFYRETGKLALDGEREGWMEEHGVAFCDVKIGALCCCCEHTRLGEFQVRVKKGKFEVSLDLVGFVREEERVKACFENVLKGMRKVVAEAEAREGFVGLTFGDLKKMAGCLRWRDEVVLE